LDFEKPDALWFVTDPRFYGWLFNCSDEIKDRGVPLFWWTIWDCEPTPLFNKPYYDSCDFLGCISKLTHNIVTELVGPEKCDYIPHAVDENIFKVYSEEEKLNAKKETFKDGNTDRFVVFYNSRNARRKCTSDVIRLFKKFADIVGNDKVFLLMHTDPFDGEGANLLYVAESLGVKPTQIAFSNARESTEQVVLLYNM